jgi:hypothetical protein
MEKLGRKTSPDWGPWIHEVVLVQVLLRALREALWFEVISRSRLLKSLP